MPASEYLKHALKSGIRPQLSFSEKKEIIFTNKVALSLALIGFSITILELTIGIRGQAVLSFCIFLFVPMALLFQQKGSLLMAKLVIWGVPTLVVFSGMVLYGTNGNIHYYLIALLAISLIFSKKHWVKAGLFVFHVGLFIFMESIEGEYVPYFLVPESPLLNLANLVIMTFTIWLLLFEFQNHEHIYDSKIKDLMSSLKDHSELLEYQKKQIEKQTSDLLLSNRFLKKEVVEKEAVRKKLMASNVELKQYASIVSHDLKEPLRTVGSFTQLIHRRHEKDFDDTSKEYAIFVVDAVSRMSALLDDLLEFSRLSRPAEKKETDLNTVVELARYNLLHQIHSVGGSIQCDGLPELKLNRQQFTQLFQNLISNALKFRREEVPPQVFIKYFEKEKEHLFLVQDNGIGIDTEYHEKIFSLFQRLHSRHEYEGTGIGLSICRKVVQNHGGRIWLEPSPEAGATIAFSIPKNIGPCFKVEKGYSKKAPTGRQTIA